jgi:hypothetical protein
MRSPPFKFAPGLALTAVLALTAPPTPRPGTVPVPVPAVAWLSAPASAMLLL